jgi:hypothetical protein
MKQVIFSATLPVPDQVNALFRGPTRVVNLRLPLSVAQTRGVQQ